MRVSVPLSRLLIALAAVASMGNANGRATVSGEGNTGAPGEPNNLCFSCHNGGPYGPIITLLEVETQGGQLVASYDPGVTYNVTLTVAANAGNPAGYGMQLTALGQNNTNKGTFNNLGNNVKEVAATNPANRTYLEHKGGASATGVFTMKWTAPAAGTGDVDFYYIGAVVDGNNAKTGDNAGLGSSITLSEKRLPLPYFEDFDFGGGWTSSSGGAGASSWEEGAPAGGVIASPMSGSNAWVTNLDGAYQNDEYSYLEGPTMDFSGAVMDPVIEFAINHDTESGSDGGWLEMNVDETGWQKVGTAGPDWYNDYSPSWGEIWGGTSGGWVYRHALLSGTAGAQTVRLRFVFASNGATTFEGMAIDDVVVDESLNPYYYPEEPPPDPDPDPMEEPVEEPIEDPPPP